MEFVSSQIRRIGSSGAPYRRPVGRSGITPVEFKSQWSSVSVIGIYRVVLHSAPVNRVLHHDPGSLAQLPYIAKIIEDETWLEGERRGCAVDRRDPVVLERVCSIVLEMGSSLRDRALATAAR
jgi:hypothetical protein